MSPDSPRGGPAREVAVIGSARLGQDDPAWEVAAELGEGLARAGFTVVTGGYGGLMRATAEAAKLAGGTVVGLPMKEWTHLRPGDWNSELRWAADYPTRLGLLLRCDAVIALDGGVGTLSEMALAWAMGQTEEIAPAVILLGNRWRRIVQHLGDHLVVDARDLAILNIVDSPKEAIALIRGLPQKLSGTRARG